MRTTVQVQSRSGIPFRVVDAASDSDDIDIKLLDPAAPGGPLYEVSRRITASGAVNDTLRFTIERDNGNRSSITVPLRSYGLAAGELAP